MLVSGPPVIDGSFHQLVSADMTGEDFGEGGIHRDEALGGMGGGDVDERYMHRDETLGRMGEEQEAGLVGEEDEEDSEMEECGDDEVGQGNLFPCSQWYSFNSQRGLL